MGEKMKIEDMEKTYEYSSPPKSIDQVDENDESFNLSEEVQPATDALVATSVTDKAVEEETKAPQDIQCGECGKDISEAFKTILEELEEVDEVTAANKGSTLFADSRDEEDKLSELKSLVKLQELGISLDYRCPSFRDCSS